MKYIFCPTCHERHDLYYLIKTNNTRALFYLCPKLKGQDNIFVIFIPLIDGLSIPSYVSGSPEYDELNRSFPICSDFSEEELKIIALWRRAKLVSSQMTKDQLYVIRQYIKGDIKW